MATAGRVVEVDERADAQFDAFVRARLAELLRFGHVLCGNPHTAADLVQDALERTLLAGHGSTTGTIPRVTCGAR
jgi:DNA-directed RNA polymerase specialized sigma24 family protein